MTLMNLQISDEVMVRLRTKLNRLKEIHDREMEALEARIEKVKTDGDAAALAKEWDALHERGRRLTLANVVRAAVSAGLPELTDYDDLLAQIAEDGVPLGRPRHVGNG